MERVTGIEPASSGWKPEALPLSYTRRVESANNHVEGTCVETVQLVQTIQLDPNQVLSAVGQEIR